MEHATRGKKNFDIFRYIVRPCVPVRVLKLCSTAFCKKKVWKFRSLSVLVSVSMVENRQSPKILVEFSTIFFDLVFRLFGQIYSKSFWQRRLIFDIFDYFWHFQHIPKFPVSFGFGFDRHKRSLFSKDFWPSKVQKVRKTGKVQRPKNIGKRIPLVYRTLLH